MQYNKSNFRKKLNNWKKGKEKIIEDFKEKLNLQYEEADNLYNTCISILGAELKNKIKNPFKSKK